MKANRSNNRGIAHLGILIVAVVVLGVIGFAGWSVYQQNTKKQATNQQPLTTQSAKSEIESSPEEKPFTGKDAAAVVQEVYEKDAETKSDTQQDRIGQIKDKLSDELQAKLIAPYSGGVPHDRINCSHAIAAGRYEAALTSATGDTAYVTVTAYYTGEYASGEPYTIETTVDMKTRKLTDIICPQYDRV